MALVPDGFAARLTTDNVSDGVGLAIVGLPGLGLASSDFSYEVNTTGADTDIPVPTPLGTENLTLADGIERLEGDATFSVGGPSPDFTVGGDFTVTEGSDTLLIGGRRRRSHPLRGFGAGRHPVERNRRLHARNE